MKTIPGYTYAVTAKTTTTVTDDSGLNLEVEAGKQATFVASCDETNINGTATVKLIRGTFKSPSIAGGGGGGQTYTAGDLVLFGEGSCVVVLGNVNCMADPIVSMGSPFLCDKHIPEGVTFKNLTSGYYSDVDSNTVGLFAGAVNLGDFPMSVNLKSLVNGSLMFAGSGITSFNYDLPVMTIGSSMFYNCMALLQFHADMPFLTTANAMFQDCVNLDLFHGYTGEVQDGTMMFAGCSSLEYFEGDLRSLTNGYLMFSGCKLRLPSLQLIANTIKNVTGSGHTITIGYNSNQVTPEQRSNMDTIMRGKGWNVVWEEN